MLVFIKFIFLLPALILFWPYKISTLIFGKNANGEIAGIFWSLVWIVTVLFIALSMLLHNNSDTIQVYNAYLFTKNFV